MSHAKRAVKRVTSPEYHVAAAISKLWTDKLSHRKIIAKSCKNEQHIGSIFVRGPLHHCVFLSFKRCQ